MSMEERDSTAPAATGPDWTTPRPVDETYWVVPGRLLVGAHPGSRSRAQAMDRLRRFLEAGVMIARVSLASGDRTEAERLARQASPEAK
jgi:hypothetical protein